MRTAIRIGPIRVFSWSATFLFLSTAPFGCGDCALLDNQASAQQIAAGGEPRPTLEEVSAELICNNPSCSKESLHECTTCSYAVRHRAEIANQLKQGRTKQEILDYFANTYGEHLLGKPRSRIAVAVPFIVPLLGLIPLVLVLRSQRRRPLQHQGANDPHATRSPTSEQVAPTDDPRVTAALRDYDF